MNFEKAYKLIYGKLSAWIDDLITLLPNMVLAALILVLGVYVAKILRNFSKKLISKVSVVSHFKKIFL